MKLSIVIPCCNERENIPLILRGFTKVIKRNDIELIIVDNGSDDGSSDILKNLLPQYPFARSIETKNRGYGLAILAGLKEAKGEYIGWTHGDMQTPPEDVLKALEIIEKRGSPEKIYVKGRRKGRSIFDRFFTFGMSVFESIYLGKLLYDINAQPNIFHKSFFKKWFNSPLDFSLDLYAFYIARKQRISIVRFPVLFEKRIHGKSHWNKNFLSKLKFIKRTVLFSRDLKKRLENV